MSKIKINPGLASILLIGGVFVGWKTLITIIIFMYAFCEVDDAVKNTAINVSVFYLAYFIVSEFWNLLVSAANTVIDVIVKLIDVLADLFEMDASTVLDITRYIGYGSSIIDIVDQVATLLFTFALIGFVVAMLTGRAGKGTPISDKINEYVKKASEYVSRVNGEVVSQPIQPAPVQQPVQPQVQPMAQPMAQPVQGQPSQFNGQQ